MPQESRPHSRRRLIVTLIGALSLQLISCATPPAGPEVATAPMDVALDIEGQGMFYKGVAHIPRGFNSPSSFSAKFDLEHWSHPYGGGIGFDTHAVLGDAFEATGIFQPLNDNLGVVSLKSGRLLLRGVVSEDGHELDGHWFFDGKQGGGFRIAPKGSIFP